MDLTARIIPIGGLLSAYGVGMMYDCVLRNNALFPAVRLFPDAMCDQLARGQMTEHGREVSVPRLLFL